MNRKAVLVAVASMLVTPVSFIHAEEANLSSYEQTCREWAQEDGVQADELKAYVKKCVADMARNDSDSDYVTNQDEHAVQDAEQVIDVENPGHR